jgi:hypothetical protein
MEMVFRRLQAALFVALALATAALTAGAAEARAGRYHVYGCRTPAGQPAPADGWSGSLAPGGAFAQYAKNTCAEGGALIAALGDATSHGAYVDKAAWAFAAPAGESIAGATLFRAGDNAGGSNPSATYEFWLAGPSERAIFDECIFTLHCASEGSLAQPLSTENRVVVPSANLGAHLYASASCAGGQGAECSAGVGDASGYAAAVFVYAADITLEQNQGPSAGDAGGELASTPSVHGASALTFAASDAGSGVYEAVVSVDGQVVQSPVLNVVDAAGNSAPVLDREITVANPPAACAPGASVGAGISAQATLSASWKGTRSARLTTRFGRSATILGSLTGPSGAPIPGATIDVLATPAFEGAQPLQMTGPQTGPDGRFSVRLSRGISSRTLCLAYRPLGGAPPLTRTLDLNVRAGVALSVSPQTTSVGHEIFFHGRLLSGPIPRAGKQIVLEARSLGSAWLEFQVIRTGPRGRFRATYRFRFPGPADYQFRAVSERESDYPFAAGASNVVRVHER